MVGEVLLARGLGSEAFGQYNLVRQGVPVVVTLAVFGYDQALTREVAARGGAPVRFDQRQVWLAAAAAVVGAAVAGYLIVRIGVGWPVAIALPIAAVGVVLSNLVSGVMRASNRTLLAALSQQGHRLIAGAVFVLGSLFLTGPAAAFTLAGGAVCVGAACVVWSNRLQDVWVVTSDEHRYMRRLGVGYSLSMLALAAGDWLDQALVGDLSQQLDQVGKYSQAKLLTIYPALSIGSVLGFVALPAIAARRQTLTRRLAWRWFAAGFVAAGAIGFCLVPVARLAVERFFGFQPAWSLSIALAAVGALRLFYVLPSALLGAVAAPRQLTLFGICTLAALAVQVAVTWGLSGGDIPLAAVLGLLTATVVRVVLSAGMTVKALPRTLASGRHDRRTELPPEDLTPDATSD